MRSAVRRGVLESLMLLVCVFVLGAMMDSFMFKPHRRRLRALPSPPDRCRGCPSDAFEASTRRAAATPHRVQGKALPLLAPTHV